MELTLVEFAALTGVGLSSVRAHRYGQGLRVDTLQKYAEALKWRIVITDETLRGQRIFQSWKQRFKNAFFIIMGSYFSLVVAMLALFFAGAGLLKGFALTTIIGASIGVFITRPAYAAMVEILLND